MKLDLLYQHLHRRAVATGLDQRSDLPGGARLTVRVRGDTTTLTIARRSARVGATEEITFCRQCSVPAGATRIPEPTDEQRTKHDKGSTWYLIAYRWRTQPEQNELVL
jgi:hypothetical protein